LSEKCETVTINLVSVEDISANGLNVYPNPSAGKLTVRISNFSNSTTLEVFNLLGERMNANMAEVGTGAFSIDLSHVANGIYMVQVKDGNMVSTQRVTISH
jgi:hypothetical protein